MVDHLPPGVDATIERNGDRLSMHLPPVGLAPLRAQLICVAIPVSFTIGMTALGVWLVIREHPWTTIAFLAVWTLFMSGMAVLCLHGTVLLLHMTATKSEVVISESSLCIRAESRWRTIVREWRRSDVVAFDTDLSGLWVLTGGRERPILIERTQAELRWLANTLAEVWRVPNQEPCRTGELNVMVLITDEDGTPVPLSGVRQPPIREPLTGRIWLDRGRLRVRNSIYRRDPIRFVRRGQWFKNWRALFDGSMPLAADDFEWTQKDDQSCLHIAVCIPQGDGFDLWIWPDDRDALRSIVDEFLTT